MSAIDMLRPGLLGPAGPKGGSRDDSKKNGRGTGTGDGRAPDQDKGPGIGTDTVENIFGDPTRIDAKKNPEKVTGEIGDGKLFENVLRGASEKATSTVEYRELFQHYTPEAEEAIFKENIPLGSKYYIKRYFEGIKPAGTKE